MPNLTPRDVYNPNPSVAPTTNMPSDYLSVRANPTEFGAQIGQSVQGAGAQVEKSSEQAQQFAVQYQGLLNEHAANTADMNLAIQGGQLYDKYKSLEGLDAANAKDKFVTDYMGLYNKLGEGLNPAARRAYEQIATRRASYVIQDMNSYAATQAKDAFQKGNVAAMNTSIDQLSRYSVASNPKQAQFETGNVIFQANQYYTDPTYGRYQNEKVSTDPKTGRLQFDTSTKEGQIAQNDYDFYLNQQIGKAWYNRIMTVATDPDHHDPIAANKLYQDNKDNIPAQYRLEIQRALQGPVTQEQNRRVVDDGLSHASSMYLGTLTNGSNGTTPTSVQIGNAVLLQESGGKQIDNPGQIQPETWKAFAKPGEDIHNPADNKAVQQRIIDKYSKDYNNDPSRVAVAYFSGPSNVAPAGSPTPWKQDLKDANGKTVSSYVSDIVNRVQTGYHQTYADFLGEHAQEFINATRQQILENGGDATTADEGARTMESRINEFMTQQRFQVNSWKHTILGPVTDPKNPITSLAQLDYSADDNIRNAWINIQTQDPWARTSIANLVAANARGKSRTYGTDFSDRLMQVLSGKVTSVDAFAQDIGGDNAPISSTGYIALNKELEAMDTPEGRAFAHQESAFLDKARKVITGSGLPGIDGAKRGPLFEKTIMSLMPQIESMRSAGKTSSEIFNDPKSPVVRTMEANAITPAQIKQEAGAEAIYKMLNPEGTPANAPQKGFDLNTIKTKEDLLKNAGHLTRDQFDQLAIQHGWAKAPDNKPQVPLPQ